MSIHRTRQKQVTWFVRAKPSCIGSEYLVKEENEKRDERKDKIYYNLQKLTRRLKKITKREKVEKVIDPLKK